MSVIIETNSVESIHGVVCDGTNNNTGKSNGIIRKLEENLGRPLHWLVCLLHCNELPFRRFLACRVMHFILNFYEPSWFKIKSNSSCQNGANNFFYLVQLFQEHDALDQAVVRPVLENNCYFAHAENILLAAVSDSDMEIRRFSVEQII